MIFAKSFKVLENTLGGQGGAPGFQSPAINSRVTTNTTNSFAVVDSHKLIFKCKYFTLMTTFLREIRLNEFDFSQLYHI